jgi:hypothetical protein
MLDWIKERAKAVVGIVAPLLSIALVTHVEKLEELSVEWKAVIVAVITGFLIERTPNTPPDPEPGAGD